MRVLVFAVLLPALALAEECKELRAPDEQIQRQIQIAKSEPVQAIRKGIDEYLRGCRNACRVLEPGAMTDLGELDLVMSRAGFRSTWATGSLAAASCSRLFFRIGRMPCSMRGCGNTPTPRGAGLS
jgi:hypothetical protein